MGKTKLTKKTFPEVVANILSGDFDPDELGEILSATLGTLEGLVKEDAKAGDAIVKAMDKTLDGLAAQDFFGTEAQRDPRGDQRD